MPPPAPPNYAIWCDPAMNNGNGQRPPLPIVGAFPPLWQIKPPGGTDLYGTARATLPAAGAITLIPAPAFVIKVGWEGVLSALWLSIISPTLGMQVTFSLLVNQAPIEGWAGFTPLGIAGVSITMPIEGPLQLVQNDVLTVVATDVGGTGPFNVQVDLFGWQYPQNLRRQIFGDAVGA
jgi:hypothetical protein